MAAKYWCTGGNGNWSSSTNWSTQSGSGRSANTTQPSGSDLAYFDGISGTGTVTIDSGISSTGFDTLNIASFAGTFAFGSTPITLNGTSGTCFVGSPSSAFSVTGTPQINFTGASTGTRTLNVGTFTEAQSFNFNISAGSGTTVFSDLSYVRNITFSGTFTGQWQSGVSNTSTYIFGDLTLKTGMSIGAPTSGSQKFFIGNGTQKITSAGLTLNFPITIGTGSSTGTLQLQDDLTIGSPNARTITLLSGTLDLNNKTLTHYGNFSSNNSNTRSISGSTSLSVIKNTNTGTGTYWDCATATGFTKIGNPSVQFTGTNTSASTLTVLHGTTAGAEANAMSFFFGSAPTVNLNATNKIADLGVLPSSSITLSGGATGRTIYGGFFGGVSTTYSTNPFGVLTFASTNATARNIYLYSSYNIIFDGVGGSWQLSAAVSTSVTFTLTNGTFSTNGFNLDVGTFDFNNSNTKTLTINSTLTVNGGQFIGSATGTTTNFSGFTLTGGGYTVNTPNITIPTVTTTGNVIIGSALSTQTITNLTTTTTCIVYLYGTSTLNVTNLSLYGDSGGNGYLSTYPSGMATLSKTGGTVITSYQTIANIIATGGATWRAPTNAPYNNVDGGGNTGWNFSSYNPSGATGNFLMFF
jgi:hypothetical protein